MFEIQEEAGTLPKKEAESKEVQQARFLLQFLAAGIKVLSARFTMLLALILTFVLFLWAMSKATALPIVIATIFAILVFLPAVWLDVEERRNRAATKGELQ